MTVHPVPTWKIGRLFALGIILGVLSVRADTVTATVKSDSTDTPAETTTPDASAPASSDADVSTEKAAATPHFWQRDSRGGFENEGRDYCCPVAISNSFVYLAHHGFPSLLGEGDGVQPQIDLINQLASSDYFGTDPTTGTGPGGVLSGVQKYVENQGYHCERLEYEGWRKVGRNQASAILAARPSLDWLKQGVRDPHGAVWLNIGWYTRVGDGEWKRIGGHWVTLVGYGAADPAGAADPNLLLIHNPATRGNDDRPDDPAKDVVHLRQVAEGTLDTGKDSTEDAAGMYQLSGPGLPISRGVDAAFLDAAVVLVVGS